jgi:hypothetical protein
MDNIVLDCNYSILNGTDAVYGVQGINGFGKNITINRSGFTLLRG